MDRAEFEKRLYAKGYKRPRCPTCGSVDWHGMKSVILLPIETEGAVVNRGVPANTATCDECGYMLLYDANVFDKD